MPNPAARPNSDEEWDDLLRQLRQQPQPRLQPFFYARVHARLVARLAPESTWLPAWVRRPAYAALLVAVVLAVHKDGAALPPTTVVSQQGHYQPR